MIAIPIPVPGLDNDSVMNKKNRLKISSVHFIPISFLLAILVGTVLLLLPFSTAPGSHTDILTALFTATTSVCVTGLVVVDTYAHWSVFGQFVIMLLVQIGGLGVVSVAAMVFLMGKKKFSLGDRILLKDALNIEKNRGLLSFLKRVFQGVFLVEGIGAVLFCFKFVPRLGLLKGIWAAIFQSVSAFCNAGMDVLGPNSLMDPQYRNSPLVMFATMALIVMGGIGFVVWFDVLDGIKNAMRYHYSFPQMLSHLSEHTKLALIVTLSMIVGGTVCVLAAEYNNPETIGNLSLPGKIFNSLFQSITFRTAGFASVPQDGLTEVTCLIGYIFMFIGGSPIGTAGGVKTVTAFLFIMNAFSYIKGQNDTVIFRRRVSTEMMRKASAIVFVSLSAVFIMTVLLMFRGGIPLTDALYEVVSALGTVGLSRSLTPNLDSFGRIIIIASMYLGRIGPISMAFFFTGGKGVNNKVRYSEGSFFVG